MTTNTFDTEESNSNINSPQYFVDDDGSLKFISPVLSSSNFDGSVPVFEGQITASAISPGKFIKTGGEYFPVISVAYDDQELEESPSDEIAVTYLDSNSEVQEIIYNLTDDVDVKYENWEEKYLGTQGWSLTYGGNAIFANVGVRGEIEATTLDVGGANGITYDGSTVIIGASVVVNAPIEFNGVTPEELASELSGYIPDGGAAGDIVSFNTKITGGNIETGRIRSTGYQGPGTGSAFSTAGMLINLDDGGIASKNFRVDPQGNAFFKGNITGSKFQTGISNPNQKISINDEDGVGTQPTIIFTTEIGANKFYQYYDSINGLRIFSQPTGTNQNRSVTFDLNGGSVNLVGGGSFTGNGSGLTNIPAPANAVLTTDSYANPSWITSLAGSKISGNISGNADNITRYTINQNLGTGNNVSFNTISTANAGSSIKPSNFTNNQTTLQIRVSDSAIGIVGSTLNIKTDIVPLIGDQLHIVTSDKNGGDSSSLSFNPDSIFDITPVEYTVIEDESQERQVGFIVEDLLEVWPQAVTYNGTEPISYNTNSIVAGLVYAVKKQKKLIEDLEARVLQLESQLGG